MTSCGDWCVVASPL